MIYLTKIVGETINLETGAMIERSVVLSNGIEEKSVQVSDDFILAVISLQTSTKLSRGVEEKEPEYKEPQYRPLDDQDTGTSSYRVCDLDTGVESL